MREENISDTRWSPKAWQLIQTVMTKSLPRCFRARSFRRTMLAPLEEAVTADTLTVKCVDSMGWENKTDVDIIIKEKKKNLKSHSFLLAAASQKWRRCSHREAAAQKTISSFCQLGFLELDTGKEQGNDHDVTLEAVNGSFNRIVTVSAAFKSSTKSLVMLVQMFTSQIAG